MTFDSAEFGKRLRGLRKQRGMTQEQLAEDLNISLEHMRQIEKGTRSCSIAILDDIARYFNVSSDHLLFGRQDESQTRQQVLSIIGDLSELAKQL